MSTRLKFRCVEVSEESGGSENDKLWRYVFYPVEGESIYYHHVIDGHIEMKIAQGGLFKVSAEYYFDVFAAGNLDLLES